MSTMARLEADRLVSATDVAGRLMANIGSVVHGKDAEIRLVVAALACEGHVLFEDVPGTAKTVLARAIAGSIEGVQFARIQCTPDLQPTDVTGLAIFDQKQRDFEFRPGPVFAHVLLVDEINRAMPKTQSALLEAMAEGQVTVDGETRRLPEPFILLATENPIEHEGTFPLPEAQLDRFFLRTSLGYPGAEEELQIIRDQVNGHPLKHLQPVVTLAEVKELQTAVRGVYADDLIQRWIVDLVRATRDLDGVAIGASVRGTLALEHAARAFALLVGREFVVPADVDRLIVPVLCHRIAYTAMFHAEARRTGWEAAIEGFRLALLDQAPRPEMPDSEIGAGPG
jgi:MoxR-like ATPase